MNDLKEIFAKNLSDLRVRNKWTQLELGEKLNYSDKTVSKWERGESIPDASVLKQIAELFGITLDEFLTDHSAEENYWDKKEEEEQAAKDAKKAEKAEKKQARQQAKQEAKRSQKKKKDAGERNELERKHDAVQHTFISAVAVAGVWVVSLAAMIITWAAVGKVYWMFPVATLPVTFILLIVFNSLWGGRRKLKANFWLISLLILSILLTVYLPILAYGGSNPWMLFLIMIPVEILLVLVFRLSSINRWFWKKFGTNGEGEPETLNRKKAEEKSNNETK